MSNTVLQAKQLSWQVAGKSIIENVDFELNRGETVAIVGPNGAGKTSLLKCLHGEHNDFDGSITLNSKPLSTLHHKNIAKQIAVVSQQTNSVFDLTVVDIVRMGLIPHKSFFENDNGNDANKIHSALSKVDLLEQQQQVFNTLSGGEQQRVLIARAVVQAANILIMDEPTNHLDIYYQHQILALAKKLKITLLLTIHDLNLAAEYCDRIVLMDHGKIVANDTPEQVLTPHTLKSVFNLDCAVDKNPFTNKPRITFSAHTDSAVSTEKKGDKQ
ncbi:ABC transporter ATP-binding protein [Thalassotalea sp. ND16A]|uniref:ABC transporter ATP-binding protein n=1 Tax=Thalassotalea sp. ND16A TaxID=1535422 RepID=UPI00051D1575|nr:ABC transporter ATP-binding protein [Thalassotalea sp. ND16A]KGJ99020.1 Iron-chelate-transporting ATPase [Thalassotalea sp. ND16A]